MYLFFLSKCIYFFFRNVFLAGLSEDSDYTSDVGYPILQQQVIGQPHHQQLLYTNVHHANSPAFQFGASGSIQHQTASDGQYIVNPVVQVGSENTIHIVNPVVQVGSENTIQNDPYSSLMSGETFQSSTTSNIPNSSPRKLPQIQQQTIFRQSGEDPSVYNSNIQQFHPQTSSRKLPMISMNEG